jgi:hypothetical protein
MKSSSIAVSSMELMAVEAAPLVVAGEVPANERENPIFCAGDLGIAEGTS